jgi:hypothetical protein
MMTHSLALRLLSTTVQVADPRPTEGAGATEPDAVAETHPGEPGPAREPTPPSAAPRTRPRPDWALRMSGGFAILTDFPDFAEFASFGGHLGLAVHVSQRFGPRQRGYIGGGPRLSYRGRDGGVKQDGYSQPGLEGTVLIGGGSKRVVGVASMRLGLGFDYSTSSSAYNTTKFERKHYDPALWLLGGGGVLVKLAPQWSLGGHAEFGIYSALQWRLGFEMAIAEIGLDVAWHFGRGRRDGI